MGYMDIDQEQWYNVKREQTKEQGMQPTNERAKSEAPQIVRHERRLSPRIRSTVVLGTNIAVGGDGIRGGHTGIKRISSWKKPSPHGRVHVASERSNRVMSMSFWKCGSQLARDGRCILARLLHWSR